MNALRNIANPHIVRALAGEFFNYESAGAHKLLSDNRDLYVRQSAATRAGSVAPFPGPPATNETSPVSAGGLFSSEE
jgi:hypothetical protein